MLSKRILCILAFFINLNCIPASETYKSIMWDPQNPLFGDGNANCDPAYKYKLLKIRSASKIKFICPNVATVLQTTKNEVSKANKYENLWLLYNKTSFDKCDTTLEPKVTQPLIRCNEPTALQFHSITFQPHAAEDTELTFHKGLSYYFIATSNGLLSHINDTSGGHCNDAANNVSMKIEVYVCNSTDEYKDPKCASGVGELECPKLAVPSSTTSTATPTPTPTPTPTSTPTVTASHATISTTTSKAGVVQTRTYTTTTTSTVTTATTAATSEAIETLPTGAQNRALQGSSDKDSKTAWMASAMVFMVICIVIVLAIVFYFFCGKKKKCQYEPRKVEPSPEYGKKNLAFKHDPDGKEHKASVTAQDGESLPDKDAGLIIYNAEVFYNRANMDGKDKNPPV